MTFVADQQTNPGSSRMKCSKLAPIERGLPAHSAPIGLSFLTGSRLPAQWADGAVAGGHGSWDRQPPRPPVVYWMPWDAADKTLGRAITLVSGFQDPDGSRWGRVADAVAGPDGSLYVTDDQSGAVYRITP
jgi:glucose/arabinose dehydrogenase